MTNIYGADIAFASGAAKVPVLASKNKAFIILKATQDDFEDSGFKDSLAAAKAATVPGGAHLIRGAYHFLVNSKKVHGHPLDASISATAQANNFLDTVHTRNGSYDNILLALDVEPFHRFSGDGKTVVYRSVPELQDVDDFVARFQERLPSSYLLIYTRGDVWDNFGNPKFADKYGNKVRLWLANWTGHPNYDLRLGHLAPTIHQYKVGYIDGHHNIGQVDLDATNLTRGQLKTVANWTSDGPDDPPDDPFPVPDTNLVVINDPELCRDDVAGDVGPPIDDTTYLYGEDSESVAGTGYDAAISYDADIPYDGVIDGLLEFEVEITPANLDDAVEFDWATHDGTAVAGTHYVADSGHATVAIGGSRFAQAITMLQPASASGDKTLSVVLTNPVNAIIADPTSVLTLHYATNPPPPPPPPGVHNIWPHKITVYDQYKDGYPGGCTAYATAAATSCDAYLDTGNRVKFNAPKLFGEAGCCGAVLTLGVAKHRGVQVLGGSHRRKMKDFRQISGEDHADLIQKIKHSINKYGPVQMESIWYQTHRAGNTTSMDWMWNDSWPHHILPDPDDYNAKSCLGHDTILIGWDDDIASTGKGGFLLQSSFGKSWGDRGRVWLTYTTITMKKSRSGATHCTAGTGGPVGYPISDPWFRFYRTELKKNS